MRHQERFFLLLVFSHAKRKKFFFSFSTKKTIFMHWICFVSLLVSFTHIIYNFGLIPKMEFTYAYGAFFLLWFGSKRESNISVVWFERFCCRPWGCSAWLWTFWIWSKTHYECSNSWNLIEIKIERNKYWMCFGGGNKEYLNCIDNN